MSIASEIKRIAKASADIKASIKAKGVAVPEGTLIDGCSALIDKISGENEDRLLNREITTISNDKVKDLGSYALAGCYSLVSASFPNVTKLYTSAFYRCTNLTDISFPNLLEISTDVFNGCTKLSKADLKVVASIGQSAFSGCTSLKTLIIRTSTCASLGNSAFFNTPIGNGIGDIYVPSNLVDAYKSATNWSALATQIRAIEDYPDITGG